MAEEQNNNKEEQKIKRGKNFDVFISYRRSDGTDKARILDLAFSIDDCRTFLDFKSLGTGVFEKKLENAVLDAPIFIMVLTPDYFARCVKKVETPDGKTVFEPDEDDWVRKEIELALKHNKKIIPINFNHVLDNVPDYLDDEFRNKISPHNYVNLYGDNTFDDAVKGIFDREIRPFIGATPKPENKVKVRVKADADCELLEDDEFLATIQAGKSKEILLERGEYKITARSTEFSNIEKVLKKALKEVDYRYRLDVEIANKVQDQGKEITKEYNKDSDTTSKKTSLSAFSYSSSNSDTNNSKLVPIEIKQIDLANIKEDGTMISGWGVNIKASEAEFLAPRIYYKATKNSKYTLYTKWIKCASPDSKEKEDLLKADWSPEGYTQSFERDYDCEDGIDYFNSWKYDKNIPWPAGDYAIEIWCEDTLLKRKEFTIY